MSNISNRNENKSPNPKLARYLQRIEQLVGHRNRTPSPLASRSPRPLKPNALDHYLKYQLTFKILCNVADKKNQACIRSKYDRDQTKVQKIYKFVPIEKTQCTHMIIDTGISIKMLTSILKNMYKSNLKHGFNSMKSLILTQSQLMSLNTARSNRSNITPLSSSQSSSNRKYNSIGFVLYKIYMRRVMGGFDKIKNYRDYQVSKGNSMKSSSNFRIVVNKYINLDMVKLCFLGALFDKIKGRNVQAGFYGIERYVKQVEVNEEKDITVIENSRKMISTLATFLNYKSKRHHIQTIKYLSQTLKAKLQKQKQIQQQSLCEKVSAMVSTSSLLGPSLIYDGTNKINISLMSIVMRRKMEFMRSLVRYGDRVEKGGRLIVGILGRKAQNRLLEGFIKIKDCSEKCKLKKSKNSLTLWMKIGRLININKYFTYTLKQPFNTIKDHSLNKMYIQQNIKSIQYYFNRNKLKQAFVNIKDYGDKIQANRTKSFIDAERLSKQFQLLPRILNKLVLLRYTQFFIKLKSNKNRASLKSSNVNSSKTYIGWISDIESFISERDRFNKNITENYQKINSMINSPRMSTSPNINMQKSMKQNTNREDDQSPIISRSNTFTKDQVVPKIIFSPKNRNIKKAIFPN